VVLSAADRESPDADRALERLCHTYWFPLYAHVRRLGYGPDDAEDLTQGFFAKLLEKEWLGAADRTRGRFRTFLLGALKHFLANEWDRSKAKKRGGQVTVVPLDRLDGESRLGGDPDESIPPDRIFDRQWALTILETVLARLETEYADKGKKALYETLKSAITGEPNDAGYDGLTRTLGMSKGAVRVAVHRLRGRYRELLREEIAQTIAPDDDLDAEMRYLLEVLSCG